MIKFPSTKLFVLKVIVMRVKYINKYQMARFKYCIRTLLVAMAHRERMSKVSRRREVESSVSR